MWRKVKWIALSLTAVILCVVGYYGYSLYQFGNHIQEKQDDPLFSQFKPQPTSQKEEAPPKWEGKERVNILLLGADARGLSKNEVPRSDTIMVVSVDPVTKKANLFSILRDTYLKIPGHGDDRINAALANGGPNLAMKTVGDLLGLSIQYYVYTDFQGFMALVDAIGGIELEVEKDMKYRDSEEPEFDINLKKGLQHMDGKTALQYVRFRHDAMSDYSRTERQRKFMTAVAEELQTTSSILRLPSILNKIDPYITTNISITDMIKLGSLGFEVKAQGINSQQIPPLNLLQEDNIGGASVITVNKQKLHQFVKNQLERTSSSDDTETEGTEPERNGSGSASSTNGGGTPARSGSSSSSSGVTAGGSDKSGTSSGATSGGTKTGASGGSSTTGTGTSSTKPPSSTGSTKPGTASGSTSGSSAVKPDTGTAGSGTTNGAKKPDDSTSTGAPGTGNKPDAGEGKTGSGSTPSGTKPEKPIDITIIPDGTGNGIPQKPSQGTGGGTNGSAGGSPASSGSTGGGTSGGSSSTTPKTGTSS
ncbi:LCP family protein [Paenibacillus sp. IB182363]|uniref:LCP family protein n=1 Tax=Paenibacillus oceani TaxID=2772510 RepID=A0A927H2X7_9BACL|nr:LCP family protein [Paenibacillus oceani]